MSRLSRPGLADSAKPMIWLWQFEEVRPRRYVAAHPRHPRQKTPFPRGIRATTALGSASAHAIYLAGSASG
jgi:hypothetical protein